MEVHIEQAPQLIEAGLPVAIGTGVPGNFRYPQVRIAGEYAHVGLPRRFRHDAVLAASEFALGLDEIWKQNDASGRPMAFTIGRFHTDPKEHALTKVAGELTLSLDVRAYDKAHLAELEGAVLGLARDVGQKRGVRFDLGARASADVAPSHPEVFAKLTDSAKRLGIPDDAAGKPSLARHRHVHGCGRAVLHAVRAQRQRQPQSARGHGDRRLPAGRGRADALHRHRVGILSSLIWKRPSGPTRTPMDAIAAFADHVVRTRFHDLPGSAVQAAKTFILDTFGVGMSGSSGPMACELAGMQEAWGQRREARVWGNGRCLPAPAAAMCNAYQAHNSEFDCVHEEAVVHAMTVVLPWLSQAPSGCGASPAKRS